MPGENHSPLDKEQCPCICMLGMCMCPTLVSVLCIPIYFHNFTVRFLMLRQFDILMLLQVRGVNDNSEN